MNKNFFGKLIFLLAILATIVLVILAFALEDVKFEWSYIVAALSGLFAILFIARAVRAKDVVTKKAFMFPAIILIVVCAIALIFAFIPGFPTKYKVLICVGALVVGFIIQLFVTGGNKWDSGDNEKVGYKNYYERKAEEEKNKNK